MAWGSQFVDLAMGEDFRGMSVASRGLLAATMAIDCDDDEPEVLTQAAVEAAQHSLLAHTVNCYHERKGGYRPNWHHVELCKALEAVQRGDIKRLMVLMPPRHGKSELVSKQFPAWCLGKNPDERIIACSYSADLAATMGRGVQRIMGGLEYQDEFETRLGSTQRRDVRDQRGKLKETELFFEVSGGSGYYLGAGVGGAITGKGFGLGIVDDPIKNRAEAESPAYRKKVWDWWVSTFLTRSEGGLAPGGHERIIVCLTPWHEDDLAGRILANAEETGEEWTVIRFPAIYEDEKAANCGRYVSTPGMFEDPREPGEALWADVFNAAWLKTKELTNAREWSALYQCRPSPEKGNIFERSWWQYYDTEAELLRFEAECFTLDAAFKDLESSSYVVLQRWGRRGPNRYLVQQWRGHKSFVQTLDMCRAVFKQHDGVVTKLIEEKANGAALISMLKEEFDGIVAISPKDPKHVRALAVADIVRAGNVFLPRHDPQTDGFVEEATVFPFGKFDDQVDAMTQMLQHWTYDAGAMLRALGEM